MSKHNFNNGELIIRDENLQIFPRTKSDVKGEIASYYAMISELILILEDLNELKKTNFMMIQL